VSLFHLPTVPQRKWPVMGTLGDVYWREGQSPHIGSISWLAAVVGGGMSPTARAPPKPSCLRQTRNIFLEQLGWGGGAGSGLLVYNEDTTPPRAIACDFNSQSAAEGGGSEMVS
jgi:hypothetical protein